MSIKTNKKQGEFTQSRRNFLKGATYTSALSIGGLGSFALSNVASAMNADAAVTASSSVNLANEDISIMQQLMLHKETVSLFNNSDKAIALDALRPVLIERVNGSLIIKPNLIQSEAFSGMTMMEPRQRISFDIQTTGGVFSSAEISDLNTLKGEHLHLTSQHSAFNRLIPVAGNNASFA